MYFFFRLSKNVKLQGLPLLIKLYYDQHSYSWVKAIIQAISIILGYLSYEAHIEGETLKP